MTETGNGTRFTALIVLAMLTVSTTVRSGVLAQEVPPGLSSEKAFHENRLALANNGGTQRVADEKSDAGGVLRGIIPESERKTVTSNSESGDILSWRDEVDERTALHLAALEGNLLAVDSLIRSGADINARDIYQQTALYMAIERHHRDIVELLLKSGAEVNIRDTWGMSPLESAANVVMSQALGCAEIEDLDELKQSSGAIMDLLISRGAEYTLRAAVMMGDMDRVEEIISADAKCLAKARRDTSGTPLLHDAAAGGSEDVVRLLLAHGFPVDETDELAFTALLYAVAYGHEKVVGILIEKGANVNLADDEGNTALHMAAQWGRPSVARLLLSKGAQINTKAGRGMDTPLHKAMMYSRNVELVDVLLKAGASVNEQNLAGFTPLHNLACAREPGAEDGGIEIEEQERILAIAQMLLDKGARLDLEDQRGLTPIDLARQEGTEFLAEFLDSQKRQPPTKKAE